MPPLHSLGRLKPPRRGISELYASMLMVGVTLTMGGLVASAALGQFGLANSSSSVGASLDQSSADVMVGLVYLTVTSSGSCPIYEGYHEGATASLALYDYGSVGFTPAEVVVNGTAFPGTYSYLAPGTLGIFQLSLGLCARAPGQTVFLADALGDEVQLAS